MHLHLSKIHKHKSEDLNPNELIRILNLPTHSPGSFSIIHRKRRKGITQTKDFDHHPHLGPPLPNGNGLLYEDLSHARPRPPIATPSIEVCFCLEIPDAVASIVKIGIMDSMECFYF